jgi:hypothetical protein
MRLQLIILICLYVNICFSQQSKQLDSSLKYDSNPNIITINFNSNKFIRIFDGFELPEDSLVPKNIEINSIRRTNDTLKLKQLGIKNYEKPYMILCSFPTSVRQFIYSRANISYELKEINLPIIINNKIITFNKYQELNKLDTNRIVSVKYYKSVPEYFKINMGMPFGVISVTYK